MEEKRKILKATRRSSPRRSNPGQNYTKVDPAKNGQVSTRRTSNAKAVSSNRPPPVSSSSHSESSKFNRSKVQKNKPIINKKTLGLEKTSRQPGVSPSKPTLSDKPDSVKKFTDKSVPHDFGLKLKKGTFNIPKKVDLHVAKDSKLLTGDSSNKETKDNFVVGDLHAIQSKSKDNVVTVGGGGTLSYKFSVPGVILPSTSEGTISDTACEEMEWESTVQEIKNLWPKASSNVLSNAGGESLDRNADFDDMEVDSIDFTDQLILIADTNIWIHCPSFLRELLDTKFKLYSYAQLVIPWMVLQELDVFGKSKGGLSRQAINYIYKLLSTNHPRVTGQKASDACCDDPNFDKRVADDSILQCAQQQQKLGATVVLLTNDRNMLNKALVNNILAVDSSCGVKSVFNVLASKNTGFSQEIANPITTVPLNVQDDALKLNSTTLWKGGKRQHSSEKGIGDEEKKYRIPSHVQSDSIPQTFYDALELFRQTISYIIETKMKEEYGEDGWMRALKIPPPWTVKSAIVCIIKHYIAVFTEVFGRRMSVAEKLLDLIKSREAGLFQDSIKGEEEIIQAALGLFAAGEFSMSPIVKTDPKVRSCVQALLAFNKTKQQG